MALPRCKKHESVFLKQDIAALPPAPTSLDAMNAIVEFFLSSPRWNFQPNQPNCELWKELVAAKGNPFEYKGKAWTVDKLKAPLDISASKETQLNPMWKNRRQLHAKLYVRRRYQKPGGIKIYTVPSKERELQPDEDMKFLFGNKITFTSMEDSAGNWWIKQEQQIFTGDMFYLGYVDIKKSESVKLLQDIAALPPSSTSLDAMNAVVEFFLSSSRWNFQRDRTNCDLWKELVKAKRNPSAYEGVWRVDKLLEESTSGDPVTPHSLEAAPMERIQDPTLEGKQRDHQSPATAPMGHPANPTFDELFDDLRHSGTYKNHDNGQDEES
ncbi:hypothetical protein C8R42DRAFT_728591 [Lentinula raphanica]|nr:hypothetical protein C8R42DRAFT_728591 [Lentinula raphanica]